MNETVTVSTADGEFSAYLARPAGEPAPAIVVVQEILGVNPDIRATADELARAGFVALAPDLFWRTEPGIQLSAAVPAEWDRGVEIGTALDLDKSVADVAATIETARALPCVNGKVGVMGFCLGGLLTFLAAARTDADAFVAYYGGRTEQYLGEAGAIRRPLLMHLAGEDEYMPKAAQAAIHAALAGKPDVVVQDYPGRNHAFARHNGAHYHVGDAATANARTVAFFREKLA